jgi:hypothetical protein
MNPRYTGTVCHLNEVENYAEIRCPGMVDVSVDYASLRRVGADRIGAAVSFEHGNIPSGPSGAVAVALVP